MVGGWIPSPRSPGEERCRSWPHAGSNLYFTHLSPSSCLLAVSARSPATEIEVSLSLTQFSVGLLPSTFLPPSTHSDINRYRLGICCRAKANPINQTRATVGELCRSRLPWISDLQSKKLESWTVAFLPTSAAQLRYKYYTVMEPSTSKLMSKLTYKRLSHYSHIINIL